MGHFYQLICMQSNSCLVESRNNICSILHAGIVLNSSTPATCLFLADMINKRHRLTSCRFVENFFLSKRTTRKNAQRALFRFFSMLTLHFFLHYTFEILLSSICLRHTVCVILNSSLGRRSICSHFCACLPNCCHTEQLSRR